MFTVNRFCLALLAYLLKSPHGTEIMYENVILLAVTSCCINLIIDHRDNASSFCCVKNSPRKASILELQMSALKNKIPVIHYPKLYFRHCHLLPIIKGFATPLVY